VFAYRDKEKVVSGVFVRFVRTSAVVSGIDYFCPVIQLLAAAPPWKSAGATSFHERRSLPAPVRGDGRSAVTVVVRTGH
jgi:hypothetical protein